MMKYRQSCGKHPIFVDYNKAFDMVDHRMLFETMIEMSIPYHLVQLIEGLYINQEAAVRWNRQLTNIL